MVVELFYLIGFVVGLGAFFVFFVVGTKIKETTVIKSSKKKQVPNIIEKKQSRKKEEQSSEQKLKIEIFKVQRKTEPVSVIMVESKEQSFQSMLNQVEQYSSKKIVREQPLQASSSEKVGDQQVNIKYAGDGNLPKINQVSSSIEGESKAYEQSEIAQNGIVENSQIIINKQTQEKASFIRQLNDEHYEQKQQIFEKVLDIQVEEKQIQDPLLQSEQKWQISNHQKSQIVIENIQNNMKKDQIDQIEEIENSNRIDNTQIQEPQVIIHENKQENIQSQRVQTIVQQQNTPQEQNKYRVSQVESNREKNIKISKSRQRSRLQAMKNHYKKIIAELQNKLQSVCIRNNESFSVGDADKTITFSQQDSVLDLAQKGDEAYFLELKVEEVCTLKDQLKFQEQIITNLLQEDQLLKSKLQTLQQENKNLRLSKISETPSRNLKQSYLVQQIHQEINSQAQKPKNSQTKLLPSTISNNLHASHAVFTPKSNIYGSRAESSLPIFSTISMVSIVEGVISIGLLSQCRFLNEISKRFAINEVKKAAKQKFIDSQLVFNNHQILIYESEQNFKLSTALYERENLIILIKLQNGKAFALFVRHPIEQIHNQDEPKQKFGENSFVFIDLNKRKSTSCFGSCFLNDEALIWGNQELVLQNGDQIYISNNGQGIISSTLQKNLNMFQSEGQVLNVEFLYIYALYTQN